MHKKSPCPSRRWLLSIILDFRTHSVGCLNGRSYTLWPVCSLRNARVWFVLAFAASCALGSAYGFLQGAWPFGLVEAVWSVVAIRRWLKVRKILNTGEKVLCSPSSSERSKHDKGIYVAAVRVKESQR